MLAENTVQYFLYECNFISCSFTFITYNETESITSALGVSIITKFSAAFTFPADFFFHNRFLKNYKLYTIAAASPIVKPSFDITENLSAYL